MPDAAPAKVNPLEAYKLRVLHGLTFSQIAQYYGVAKQSVHESIQRFVTSLPTTEQQTAFEQSRPALLTAVEEQLLASLTDPAKIEKASLNNVAYAFQQVHTARRLETGQSTSNLSILSKLIESADDRLYPQASRATDQPVRLTTEQETTEKTST